jgi:hypothetical protein
MSGVSDFKSVKENLVQWRTWICTDDLQVRVALGCVEAAFSVSRGSAPWFYTQLQLHINTHQQTRSSSRKNLAEEILTLKP